MLSYLNLNQYAELCQLDLKKLFCSFGMMYVRGITTDEQKNILIEKAKKHAADILDFVKNL